MSENHIVKAFNEGKPIRHKLWGEGEWIVKISEKRSMSQYGDQQDPTAVFKIHPNDFEVVKEENNEKFEHLAVINPFSKFNLNDVPVPSEKPKNPILEAYEAGKRIRMKHWDKGEWVQKQNDDFLINNKDAIYNKRYFIDREQFTTENWELYEEIEAPKNKVEHNHYQVNIEVPNFEQTIHHDSIQQAIDLLKANGYEIYKIEKTKL